VLPSKVTAVTSSAVTLLVEVLRRFEKPDVDGIV